MQIFVDFDRHIKLGKEFVPYTFFILSPLQNVYAAAMVQCELTGLCICECIFLLRLKQCPLFVFKHPIRVGIHVLTAILKPIQCNCELYVRYMYAGHASSLVGDGAPREE